MNFVQAPTADVPSLDLSANTQFTGLNTPSLTSAALARAHSALQETVNQHRAAAENHAADVAGFVRRVRELDAKGAACLSQLN